MTYRSSIPRSRATIWPSSGQVMRGESPMWAAPTVLRGRRAVDRHGVVWQPSDRATTRSGRWSTLQCCSRRPVGMLGRPNIDRRRLHTAVPSHPLGRIPRRPVPAPAGFNVASAAPHLQALPESRPAAQTTESAGRVAGTPAPESGAGHLRPRTGSGPSPRRLPVGRTVGLLCRLPAAVCGDGRNHLGGQGHPGSGLFRARRCSECCRSAYRPRRPHREETIWAYS